MGLGVCSACKRHARGDSCPFCGGAMRAFTVAPRERLSRARMVMAAVVVTSCGSDNMPPPLMSLYGGPPVDASFADAPPDAMQAAYGGPPDTGVLDAGSDASTSDSSLDGPTDARPDVK